MLTSDPALLDDSTIISLSYKWVEKDPPAAAKWIASLPAGHGKQQAQRELIFKWGAADPVAISEWVPAIPGDAPDRQSAINYLSRSLTRSDPEAAMHWSAEVEDPQYRAIRLKEAAASWVDQDRSAAQAALDSGDLPETSREVLAEQLESPK